MRKKLGVLLGFAALAFVFTACAPHATQDSLKPQGPYADKIYSLFIPVVWIAAVVFVIVEGGIVLIMIKYRHRKGQDRMPAQTHGNTRLEIGWTILPTLVLAVLAVFTVQGIWDFASKPPANSINVRVTGQQFWWKFEYTDPSMQTAAGTPLTTANNLVIPTGRTVYLSVESHSNGVGFEVIHSFWVPELAGKQDAVPGRTNHIKLEADHPGVYTGQCAELCGLSHANMRFQVIALSPADYEAWVKAQAADALSPAGGTQAEAGMNLFMNPLPSGNGSCVACHSIQGTPAAGIGGPNLTHFASRTCFAGCLFDNTDPEQIAAWLRDPASVKPGAVMPNYHLSDGEIEQLVAYLQSLK